MQVPGNRTILSSVKKFSCSDLSSRVKKMNIVPTSINRFLTRKFDVGDVKMVEEKRLTTVMHLPSYKVIKKIESHTRRIGDKVATTTVTVTKKTGNRVEESDLSAEELKQFNDEWDKVNKPSKDFDDQWQELSKPGDYEN